MIFTLSDMCQAATCGRGARRSSRQAATCGRGGEGVKTPGEIGQATTCGRGGRSDSSSSGHVRSWRREGDDPRGRPAKRPRAVVEAWLSSRQAATCDRGGEGCVIPGEICQAATCGRGGRRNSPSSGHVRSWGRDGVDPRRRSVKRPRAVVGAGKFSRQAATCGREGAISGLASSYIQPRQSLAPIWLGSATMWAMAMCLFCGGGAACAGCTWKGLTPLQVS